MAEKRKTPLIGVISFNASKMNDQILAEGFCVVKLVGSKEIIDTNEIRIDIPYKEKAARIEFGSRYGIILPRGFSLNSFKLEIDIGDARNFDIQNKLIPVYKDGEGGRFLYSVFDWRKGNNKNSRVIIEDGLAMYFRQTKFNTLNFTVREANYYDTEEGQRRIVEAEKRAKKLANNNLVLMYEKNCLRYEESASVLYERLIDAGYDNVFFIVDTSIPAVFSLDEKYKKNLIEKGSDKHLEYFFACNKFISSETIDHALQLRIANKTVLDKINNGNLSYVFLQHGVMYMVSLNSKLRTGFRKKENYNLHKTVVSSETEARHFIELAGMSRDDLYITGLAKFDKCYRNNGADKIIIMPTWRRWEANQAKKDVRSTGYYRMIESMYNAVPVFLREKVVILPHPLMSERFKNGNDDFEKHILTTDNYDETLRDCCLLITDYSSIAYDAFYRGANVVFYWKEKDECMEYYGEGSYLMLNEENAFGQICMTEVEMKRAIEESYCKAQDESYVRKYRNIVTFHDGKNSERIIDCLRRDGML